MELRYKLARSIAISGFTPDAAPTGVSAAHIALDDWMANQAGNQPTRGHSLRVRFLNAVGVELLGGSITLQEWGKTTGGFWLADAAKVCTGTGYYSSALTGELFVAVSAIGITSIPTAVVAQIWVCEGDQRCTLADAVNPGAAPHWPPRADDLPNMPTTLEKSALGYVAAGNVDSTHNKLLTAAQLAEIVASLTAPSVVSTNTYTPVLTDAFLVKAMTYAGAVAVTLPQDSDLAFPVGSSITFKCANAAGKVTFAAGTGATMTVARTGCASLIPQNAWGEVYKYAANTWELIGPFVG